MDRGADIELEVEGIYGISATRSRSVRSTVAGVISNLRVPPLRHC